MGLLSDPDVGSVKWVRLLKRVHGPVCFLCYVGALVWFALLGHREFNNETYFSENALLPGLMNYEDIDDMPVPWLVGKMSQIHLEVYTHNFTLHYPLGQGQVFRGTNVYGILRAPRTSSLEALVVSSQKYWAKDIIFLVTQHDQLGMQAWLEAYHGLHNEAEPFHSSLGSFWKPGTPKFNMESFFSNIRLKGRHKKALNPGTLKGRSGSIQAAILLEFNTPKMIWTNGRMVPDGNHGLFHRFGIEAVTLEGRDVLDPSGKVPRVNSLSSCSFYKLGIALESILRSLNNLLERFHQSYFFYILASTDRFISIGQYMPSLCLLCVAMLIRALSLWVTTLQQDGDYNDKQAKKSNQKSSKHKLEKAKDSDSEEPGEQETEEVAKVKTPEKKKADINMSVLNIEVSVYFGIISIAIFLTFASPFLPYLLRKGPISYEELSLVNILVLTELSTVCLSVAMHNFSLGFAIAVVYTPLALMTSVYVRGSGKAR
ncbi:hypothetical protein HF086_006386 [Spodoptera exigua]|uniref:Uncharacterized protein n=1 Tax=Spodoptera exigua TaxID=7107 RepID=A0A922SPA4_SPOEX|nr:hypothetical protein HF086_006386 [Spodoptera exigua]